MQWGFKSAPRIGELGFTPLPPPPALPRSTGPRGVYVTAGLGGFYYRQRASLARGTEPPPINPAEPGARATQYLSTQAIASASVQDLSDVSQDDFVASLNEWTTRGTLQVGVAIAALAAALIATAFGAHPVVIAQVAACGAIAWLLARFLEHRRRRFLLMFDLGNDELARYQLLSAALADLATSGVFRGVKLVGHHHDWKHHAGATRSLSFEPATLRLAAPPHIVTNLTPWRLDTQGLQLYFFPDRILIRSRGRFASLAYDALELAAHTSNFVWPDALPHDAQVVGQAWMYIRRDGGPDRRFNRNRQIPLVHTAYITIKSATGLEVVVQTTRIAAAEQLVAECREYGRSTGERRALARSPRPELDAALAALGLPTLVMPADLTRVYRELAARNAPDKLRTAPPELRRFTEQRMQEISAAYHTLRKETLPASAPLDADDSAGVVAPPSALPPRRWLGIEALAVGAAVVAAGAVLAFGRPGPGRPVRPTAIRAFAPPVAPVKLAAAPVKPPPPPPPPAAAPVIRQRLASACALRAGPSPAAPRMAMLARGDDVAVLDHEDDWKLVRDDGGHEGWAPPRCWQAPSKRRARPHATVHPLPSERAPEPAAPEPPAEPPPPPLD